LAEFTQDEIQDKIQAAFGPEGPLAKTLPGYEFRESQLEMAFGVLRSFFTSRHALVESGTGTGKSIAYGLPIPAAKWLFPPIPLTSKNSLFIKTFHLLSTPWTWSSGIAW
jgi:hypothetical protein